MMKQWRCMMLLAFVLVFAVSLSASTIDAIPAVTHGDRMEPGMSRVWDLGIHFSNAVEAFGDVTSESLARTHPQHTNSLAEFGDGRRIVEFSDPYNQGYVVRTPFMGGTRGIEPIPEPGTFAMLGGGLVAASFLKRWRKK